jgi:glycosyltransferase involved in cell wall biosynthesis
MWADAEALAYDRFAADWLPRVDVVFTASHDEKKLLSTSGVPTFVVPNVVALPPVRPRRQRRRLPTIVFVGTLAYAPNADAVTWFVSRVWRRLARALHHRVRLVIVGGNPPAAIARLRWQRGIDVTGAVADVAGYYQTADVAIVPLRAGGGTRIKVTEAAAYGVPIVATTFGAQGTTFQGGVDMLMADNEANFLRACLLLLRDGTLSRRLAARARSRVTRDYAPENWRKLVAQRIACCGEARSSADEELDVRTDCPGQQSRSPRST